MYKNIFRLALPNILGNLSVPMLGAVDMALMGRMESPVSIGAISLGGVILAYVYWSFAFLRMGSAGFTAQAYGEGNSQKCWDILGRALLLSLVGGMLLILLQIPIGSVGFFLLKGGVDVEALAMDYYSIRLIGAPAVLGTFALSGWFLGMQNAVYPMLLVLTVNLLNIALDVLFVRTFHWGITGVAWATVLSNYAGLLLGLVLLHARYWALSREGDWTRVFNLTELTQFLRVNRDMFVRTLMIIFVFGYIQSKPAELGEVELAVNAILVQMVLLFSFFLDGVAYAAEALAGRYLGAMDFPRLKESVAKIFFLGALVGVLFFVFYLASGKYVVRLMTDIPSVLEFSRPYLIWAALVPLVSFAGFIWDGVYIGATASRHMLGSVFISTFCIFLPLYFLFRDRLGLHALWLAFLFFFVSRSFLQTLWARRAIFSKVAGD